MGSLIAKIFKMIGSLGASAGSSACVLVFYDEPECPKSLVK